MSLEQLESAILALGSDERRRLAIWFEEHRGELLGDTEADDELTGEHESEILRLRELGRDDRACSPAPE